MNPLSLIPTGWLLPAVAALGIALAAAIGVQTVRLANAKSELAQAQAGYAAERTTAAQALAAKEAEYRKREQAIVTDHQEREHAAQTQLASLALDVERGRAAAGSLRAARDAAVAAARAATACSPATQPSGPVAADPIGVLADVLGRADDRAGELAQIADRARIAHAACVGEYESVRARLAQLAH